MLQRGGEAAGDFSKDEWRWQVGDGRGAHAARRVPIGMCSLPLLPETHHLTKVGWATRNGPPISVLGF